MTYKVAGGHIDCVRVSNSMCEVIEFKLTDTSQKPLRIDQLQQPVSDIITDLIG
jgi:hypothetical protein